MHFIDAHPGGVRVLRQRTPQSLCPALTKRDQAALLLVGVDVAALLAAPALVQTHPFVALSYAATSLLVLACSGEYGRRLASPTLEGLPQLLGRLAVPLFLLALVSQVVPLGSGALLQAPLSAALIVAGRSFAAGWIRRQRRQGHLLRDTVVIGAGVVGADLARLLQEYPEHGLRPVGIVDDLPCLPPQSDDTLPLLGVVDDLRRVLAERGISHVIVAFGLTTDQRLVDVLRSAILEDVEIMVIPRLFEMGFIPADASINTALGIPLLHLRGRATAHRAFRAKRLLDVAVAGSSLFVLAPFLGAIALVVRLTSPGPVLFRQRRVGQHGHNFEMLKFRTMRVNDDSDVTWSVSEDDRRTLVGRLLRPLSLDELPQLWNVLIGEMSLVGPRPERPHFVDQFSPTVRGYQDRHRLPVGLTGLAQVHGLRGDTSIERRARLDNYYIEHWSPWGDIAIILSTVGEVWRNVKDDLRRSAESRRRRRVPDQVVTLQHLVTPVTKAVSAAEELPSA